MLNDVNFDLLDFDSLESHKKRLHLLGKTAEIGEWFLYLATNTMTWSDYLYEFYELEESFKCVSLLDHPGFYDDTEKDRMYALMQQAQSAETDCTAEFKIKMRDGRVKWHTTTVRPVFNEQGDISGLYGILRNITPQKLLEQHNNKAQFLYKHILDRLPDELIVFNKDGQHIYANQAAINRKKHRDSLGTEKYEAQNDLENWMPAAVSSDKDVMQVCVDQKQSATVEEKLTGPDGTDQTHLISTHPLLDHSGATEYLIGHSMDITAQKENELELQRLAYVAEKTNGIVMVTDPDRKIIWINNSFERILGYRSEEVIGRNPASFLQGPETAAETIQEITRSLQSSGTFSGEILNYTKSGEKIWL